MRWFIILYKWYRYTCTCTCTHIYYIYGTYYMYMYNVHTVIGKESIDSILCTCSHHSLPQTLSPPLSNSLCQCIIAMPWCPANIQHEKDQTIQCYPQGWYMRGAMQQQTLYCTIWHVWRAIQRCRSPGHHPQPIDPNILYCSLLSRFRRLPSDQWCFLQVSKN